MDYTYQNSSAEQPHTILLNEFNMTVRISGQESVFAYSQIVAVQLDRSERSFKTMLITDSGKILTITNKSYTENGKSQDQSRLYTTFIRVLHFHLKNKSRAVFMSGSKTRIWTRALLSVVIAFAISFTAEYFGLSLVNPYVQAVVLAAMAGIVILALHMGSTSRYYSPADIPLEFLP